MMPASRLSKVANRGCAPAAKGEASSAMAAISNTSTMNQYRREPSDENLEKYKRTEGGNAYWFTSDFLLYDEALEDELEALLDFVIHESPDYSTSDSEREERLEMFRIGRRVVQAAKRLGIAASDLSEQLSNFGNVIWLPICIWKKDEDGTMSRSLLSNLQALDEQP